MANLECWKLAGRGQGAQRDRVQAQVRSGLGERQERSSHLLAAPAVGMSSPRRVHRELTTSPT
jgi:hypothetical protein